MPKLIEHKGLSETHSSNPNFDIRNLSTRRGMIWVCNYPTLNCQMFSIGNAQFLVNLPENSTVKLEDLLLTFKRIVGGKSLMFVDIKQNILDDFKESIKEYTEKTIDTPYISTNNSKMVTVLVYFNEKYKLLEETKEINKTKVTSRKNPLELTTPGARMRGILDNDRSW